MSVVKLRILIPALIASADDARRLVATLAGLPQVLETVAHPLVQATWPQFDPETSPLLRTWNPPPPGWGLVPRQAPPEDPFPDAPRAEPSPDHPCVPVEPIFLGAPRGKWGALREGLGQVGDAAWIAVVDGDDAYDLAVLSALLWRADDGEGDLFQGARERIVLDDGPQARRRALLEPVVNELLRARLAARGTPMAADVADLQSGLFLARRDLLERFLARDRMDGADRATAPVPLPWSAYGGELHLHAFAAACGAQVRGHRVIERAGRVSGQTPAGIGAQLRASVLFAGVSSAERETAVLAAGGRVGWGPEQIAAARAVATEAFPELA